MGVLFDVVELDKYYEKILKIAQDTMPRESKKFMRQEGRKLRTVTRKKARKKVKKKTGNYLKGIKTGKVYKYKGNDALAIRVYGSKPAHHAHLIEYGHIIRNKAGNEIGFVKGYNVFSEAGNDFRKTFEDDTNKFINEVADKL